MTVEPLVEPLAAVHGAVPTTPCGVKPLWIICLSAVASKKPVSIFGLSVFQPFSILLL
jgi:hypothetical protein